MCQGHVLQVSVRVKPMGELFLKIWYLIAILPVLIAIEGWAMFKVFISKGNRSRNLPYFLLGFFVILLIILLLAGYR